MRIGWEREGAWLADATTTAPGGPFASAPSRFLWSLTSPGPVWVDCTGTLQPGWAERWSASEGGRSWRFEAPGRLGPALTGGAWNVGAGDGAGVWSGAGSVSLRPGPEGVMSVGLSRPWPLGLPFADARLGLGSAQRPSAGTAPVSELVVEFSSAGTGWPGNPSVVPGGGWQNARDALDAQADLVVTRDPSVVRYGRGTGRYATATLPWDRIYVFLRPRGGTGFAPPPSAELTGFLAAGVRGEVRAAETPSWSTLDCGLAGSAPRPGPGNGTGAGAVGDSTLVYLAGDAVAEELAARLVALSVRAGEAVGVEGRRALGALPRRARAVPVSELRRLALSGEVPLIASLPLRPLTPCEVQQTWRDLTPANTLSVPLLMSRPTALVRSDLRATLVQTWDGLVRLFPGAGPS